MQPRRMLASIATLALAIVLGGCGDDGPQVAEATEDGDPTTVTCEAGGEGDEDVTIADFNFDPQDLAVTAGGAVAFTNTDSAPHSVWSAERVDRDPAFESVGADRMARQPEVLQQGDTSTCTFPEAGTYEYLCGVHNSMTGSVTVT